MTNEQLCQNAAAMLAIVDGKPIQHRWKDDSDTQWMDTQNPVWNMPDYFYRPKPEPVSRQWSKPEDVPGPVCWLRYVGDNENHWLVIGIGKLDGIQASLTADISWEDVGEYEYSTDRKVWNTCTIIE